MCQALTADFMACIDCLLVTCTERVRTIYTPRDVWTLIVWELSAKGHKAAVDKLVACGKLSKSSVPIPEFLLSYYLNNSVSGNMRLWLKVQGLCLA